MEDMPPLISKLLRSIVRTSERLVHQTNTNFFAYLVRMLFSFLLYFRLIFSYFLRIMQELQDFWYGYSSEATMMVTTEVTLVCVCASVSLRSLEYWGTSHNNVFGIRHVLHNSVQHYLEYIIPLGERKCMKSWFLKQNF